MPLPLVSLFSEAAAAAAGFAAPHSGRNDLRPRSSTEKGGGAGRGSRGLLEEARPARKEDEQLSKDPAAIVVFRGRARTRAPTKLQINLQKERENIRYYILTYIYIYI